jgi:hypothetical protein
MGVSLAELADHPSKVSVSHSTKSPLEQPLPPHVSQGGRAQTPARPQTRPITGPVQVGTATPRASIPPPNRSTDEAAFAEIADVTPNPLVRPGTLSRSGQPARLTKIAPMIAGGALVLVLGVGAYVWSSTPRGEAPVEPPPSAQDMAAADTKVSFASTPSGASVFEDGKSIGTTPFTKTFASGDKVRRFVFKLEGFTDEVMDERLDSASVKIHARMRAALEAPQAGKGPGDTEYKDNPY